MQGVSEDVVGEIGDGLEGGYRQPLIHRPPLPDRFDPLEPLEPLELLHPALARCLLTQRSIAATCTTAATAAKLDQTLTRMSVIQSVGRRHNTHRLLKKNQFPHILTGIVKSPRSDPDSYH